MKKLKIVRIEFRGNDIYVWRADTVKQIETTINVLRIYRKANRLWMAHLFLMLTTKNIPAFTLVADFTEVPHEN